MAAGNDIKLEYRGRIAIITLNRPKTLNSLNGPLYYELAQILREVAQRDEVYITVITGTGRFFYS